MCTGANKEEAGKLVAAAETCCEEDIYHFDNTERFFLVSCLALWYSNVAYTAFRNKCTSFICIARDPSMYVSVTTLFRHSRNGNHVSAEKYLAISEGKTCCIHLLGVAIIVVFPT